MKEPATATPVKVIDLDDVLINELGQFGKFQMMNILLLTIPIIITAFASDYIFSAAALPYRCVIPECECLNTNNSFNPLWLGDVTPGSMDSVDSCSRYVARESQVCVPGGDTCPIDIFDTDQAVPCEEYVYERTNSVVYDFGLECEEWQRALAGTLSNLGTLLVLPFAGYMSDHFGRRITVIVLVLNHSVLGIILAFSNSYGMYLALRLLQTTFGGGIFSTAYVHAAELMGPKYRVLTSATMSSMFALGQVIVGGVAWAIQPWKYMILALNIPCLLIVSYYWWLPESIRWLLSKQKFEEAKAILERVAKMNKTTISETSMKALLNSAQLKKTKASNKPSVLKTIFRSRVLRRRVLTTPWWWISATFVYYGLSINSVVLPFNIYINYMIITAIEIPGYFTATLVLDRVGRKLTMSVGYFIAAACNVAFAFLPEGNEITGLILFLMGKFAISVVLTSNYLYTSELYPTEYRHSLLAFSSMIGRIGSITAPLTPALAQYWEGIPSLMFGAMGLLSGVLVLTQPDTLGTKMPDTLAEAEALGQPSSMR